MRQYDTMMDPPIEELLGRVDSKFALVTLASRRARSINSYFGHLGESLGAAIPPQVESGARKPLSISFAEIAADKITYERIDPEELAAAEAAAAADAEAFAAAASDDTPDAG
jgi:DNA-directed RNA polymerase subunit omega